MTEDQVTQLRIRLEEELGHLERQCLALDIVPCADENEYASRVADACVRVTLGERSSMRMREIREVLEQMRHWEYGLCRDCGDEIGWARLQARPTATCCVECQEARERRAA